MKEIPYSIVLFLVFFSLSAFPTLQAQESEITVEVGSHFYSHQTLFGQLGSEVSYNPPDPMELDQLYGYDQAPLYFKRDGAMAPYITISYSPFMLHVSKLQTDAHLDGRIESTTDRLKWIRFWDANVLPVLNEDHPSGASPVSYYADDAFTNWNVVLSAGDGVYENNDYHLVLRTGIRFDHMAYSFDRGLGLTTVSSQTYEAFHFYNKISLDAESQSKSVMLGPMLGADIEKTFNNVLFGSVVLGADIQYSLLHQWNNTSGMFSDIDDIRLTSKDDPSTTLDVIFDGDVPFEEEKKSWVSAFDATFRVGFRVNPVEVGAGFTISRFADMPLTPTFHNPWGLTGAEKAPTGVSWRLEERDISFSGITVYIRTKL